jgi:hypothetical protein
VSIRHFKTSQIQLQQRNVQEYPERKLLDFFQELSCIGLQACRSLAEINGPCGALAHKALTKRCFAGTLVLMHQACLLPLGRGLSSLLTSKSFQPQWPALTGTCHPWVRASTVLDDSSFGRDIFSRRQLGLLAPCGSETRRSASALSVHTSHLRTYSLQMVFCLVSVPNDPYSNPIGLVQH